MKMPGSNLEIVVRNPTIVIDLYVLAKNEKAFAANRPSGLLVTGLLPWAKISRKLKKQPHNPTRMIETTHKLSPKFSFLGCNQNNLFPYRKIHSLSQCTELVNYR